MALTYEEVKAMAEQLPAEDRLRLAELLLENNDAHSIEDLSDEWIAEIERRSQEVHDGKAKLIDADVAFAELRRLREKREAATA